MKTCRNCRAVYGDDYNGSCSDCGAPMGGVMGSASGEMSFRYARQVQDGARENGLEQSLKRGDYSRLRVEDRLREVARAGAFLLEKAAGRGQDWE